MYRRSLYYKGQSYVKYIKLSLIIIVASIPPYKGQSYVLSFQSNQSGMYPSHTHTHKIVPYIVASIPPYKGRSYVLSFQSKQPGTYPAMPTYIKSTLI